VENFSLILAKQIQSDQIQILVYLDGYFSNMKIETFALQPAPIQVHMFGYPSTTGASFFQHIVADKNVIVPSLAKDYTENIIYMPDTMLFGYQKAEYGDIVYAVEPPKYPKEGEKFGFCNTNQLFKLDPTIFNAWLNILEKVPNSVLYLRDKPKQALDNLLKEAKKA